MHTTPTPSLAAAQHHNVVPLTHSMHTCHPPRHATPHHCLQRCPTIPPGALLTAIYTLHITNSGHLRPASSIQPSTSKGAVPSTVHTVHLQGCGHGSVHRPPPRVRSLFLPSSLLLQGCVAFHTDHGQTQRPMATYPNAILPAALLHYSRRAT